MKRFQKILIALLIGITGWAFYDAYAGGVHIQHNQRIKYPSEVGTGEGDVTQDSVSFIFGDVINYKSLIGTVILGDDYGVTTTDSSGTSLVLRTTMPGRVPKTLDSIRYTSPCPCTLVVKKVNTGDTTLWEQLELEIYVLDSFAGAATDTFRHHLSWDLIARE